MSSHWGTGTILGGQDTSKKHAYLDELVRHTLIKVQHDKDVISECAGRVHDLSALSSWIFFLPPRQLAASALYVVSRT